MTKPRPAHVEPTTGTNYKTYLWPRSKDPQLDRIYQALHDLGWRYDQFTCCYHTPETDTLQGFGRLEYDKDASVWARIIPPSTMGRHERYDFDVPLRSEPILVLDLSGPEITVVSE